MKTAPTAAAEDLGLPPHHLQMEAEAQAGIYGPSFNEQWKHRSIWYGHMTKVKRMMKEPILQMGIDKITRYVFHKPFTVRFPNRSE
jgi:hypothetical protein